MVDPGGILAAVDLVGTVDQVVSRIRKVVVLGKVDQAQEPVEARRVSALQERPSSRAHAEHVGTTKLSATIWACGACRPA